jgi:hypothetical protein
MRQVSEDLNRKAIIALGKEINNLTKALNKVADIIGEHERRLKSLEKKIR